MVDLQQGPEMYLVIRRNVEHLIIKAKLC
jgi:hypothetical protein